MRNLSSMVLVLPLILFLLECGREGDTQQPAPFDTTAVVEEGQSITLASFRTLSSNLQRAMKEGGVEQALQFCSVEAMPLTDSLSANYDVQLRRASHRPRNPANRADSLEMVSIRNYLQQIEDEKELKPFVYATEKGPVYHAPIRIAGELCLSCHGQPGADITESNLEIIRELYPQDEATGFAIGDLRGIWTVQFPPLDISTASSQVKLTGTERQQIRMNIE